MIFLALIYIIPIFGMAFYEVFITKSSTIPMVINIVMIIFAPICAILILYGIYSDNKNRAKLPKGITQFK
jgi:hypothetical protein